MSEKDDNDLRRDFENLKEILEERMKTMKAENETSLAKNETAYERLRADMEKGFRDNSNTTMIGLGIVTAFLSGVIGFVTLFMNGN